MTGMKPDRVSLNLRFRQADRPVGVKRRVYSLEEEFPTSAIESVTVLAGNIPDAVLHLRNGLIVQEQSYKLPVSAAAMILLSLCIWNLPFETPRVLLGEGPTVLQVASLGILWGAICVVGGYLFLKRWTQTVTVDLTNGIVFIRSRDYCPVMPVSAVVCIQLCDSKNDGIQTNIVFRDTRNHVSRHCLFCHVRYEDCHRLAKQYRDLCGFRIVDHTAMNLR